MNKFVNLDNLQVVWDAINDKFARTSDLKASTANLSVCYCKIPVSSNDLKGNFSIILTNENKKIYDEFISFCNSTNYLKILQCEDGFYQVISSSYKYNEIVIFFRDENENCSFNRLFVKKEESTGILYLINSVVGITSQEIDDLKSRINELEKKIITND